MHFSDACSTTTVMHIIVLMAHDAVVIEFKQSLSFFQLLKPNINVLFD